MESEFRSGKSQQTKGRQDLLNGSERRPSEERHNFTSSSRLPATRVLIVAFRTPTYCGQLLAVDHAPAPLIIILPYQSTATPPSLSAPPRNNGFHGYRHGHLRTLQRRPVQRPFLPALLARLQPFAPARIQALPTLSFPTHIAGVATLLHQQHPYTRWHGLGRIYRQRRPAAGQAKEDIKREDDGAFGPDEQRHRSRPTARA